MASKIITLENLNSASVSAKNFTSTLVAEVTKTTAEAIEELEKKVRTVEEVNTGEIYTFHLENGLLYLDDGKE